MRCLVTSESADGSKGFALLPAGKAPDRRWRRNRHDGLAELLQVARFGCPNGVRANRNGRRNHAIDVTCHVWKWIDSNYGMITEADVDNLRGHGMNYKIVYKQ